MTSSSSGDYSSVRITPDQVQSLKNFFDQSNQIKTDDGCTVVTFNDKRIAEQFSDNLANVGIVGGTGNKKFVGQHIRGRADFGVVLTRENVEKITLLFSAIAASSSSSSSAVRGAVPLTKAEKQIEAGKLARNLENALNAGKTSFHVLGGYYRNSLPSIQNLIAALKLYSESGDLTKTFSPENASGMGSASQPSSVGGTIADAFESIHGGVQETIQAMRKDGTDLEIAQAAEVAVNFLRRNFD